MPPPQPLFQHQTQQYQQPQPPYVMMQPQQQQPMWGHLPPQQAHAVAPTQMAQPTSTDDVRTLWIGDLHGWMNESYLLNCFSPAAEVTNVKIIRNKITQASEGYGFIEFASRAAAEMVLQQYNGAIMPQAGGIYRLNWASAGEKRHDDTPDYTIFVGDLSAEVNDVLLEQTFKGRYPSVKSAKVVIDRVTNRSKGYGFVKFTEESEQLRAMSEMNGVLCSSRPMRIGPAANKNTTRQQPRASYQNQGTQNDYDPNNTTVFVGNLDPNVTDDLLRQVFGRYGELVHVKIPTGKRCGFVQFADRSAAEEAMRVLEGTTLGGSSVRLSWGRSPTNRQAQPEQNQWNAAATAGYYGYPPQGYEGFGYAPAAQDPSMYGGYSGYPNYQAPQQQQLGYS